jgi:hypothetical protein
MINVNQITSQLAKMPDQALQQYAAMHKNDPYTVSLALSESNRRKQMRAAGQGAQGMQPQPKVVDQVVAGMSPQPQMQPQMPQGQAQAMPEDTGIAQLPAGNMNFAEGGIISFAGGGVPASKYAVQGGASVPFGGYGGGPSLFPAKTGYEGMGMMEFLRAFGSDILDKLPSEDKERLKAADAKKAAVGERNMDGYEPRSSLSQGERDVVMEKLGLMPTAPAAPPNVPPADTTSGAQTPPPPVAPPGAQRPAGIAQLAPAPAPSFMEQYKKNMGADDANSPTAIAAERKRMSTEEVAAETAAKDARKTEQAEEMKTLFKGRDERADKREGELGKSKETNTGLAFLEAGLAMMQSKGRGLAGIAQGAGVGAKAYSAGIDKIKSAQEKLDEARDRTEELRQNQSSMNKREIRDAEKGIRSLVAKGNSDQIDARAAIYGEKKADARAATASDIAIAQDALNRQSRESIADRQEAGANARAAMPAKETQQAMMLGTGKTDAERLESGLRRLQEVAAGKFNVSTSYADYLKAFAGKDGLVAPLSFANYAAQFGAVLPR